MLLIFADDLSSVEVPEECSLAQALSMILEHDALRMLCNVVEDEPMDANEDFVTVIGKVESGKLPLVPCLFTADKQQGGTAPSHSS